MPRAGAGGRPLVAAHDVVVRTPAGAVVLGGVSVSIGRERIGVVGVNGVGETTLARVLAGEVAPESGRVERTGRVGYLPQRVEDELGDRPVAAVFGRRCAEGLEGTDLAARARVEMAWVDPRARMSALSGGERVRIALAALIASEPDVLVLDEPTNNLDAAGREALYALVASWRGGVAAISHDRRLLGMMERIVELTPRRGEVRVGVDRVALLDQHAAALATEQSVLENFMRLNPGVGEGEARGALARFLFRGHEAERRVGALSGGERLRATLGCVMGGSSPPRLLMLDEPGNHLDLESLRELEGALREFGGTMIVVSHDEAFLEAVGVQERVALGASAEGAERGRRAWERVEKRRIG